MMLHYCKIVAGLGRIVRICDRVFLHICGAVRYRNSCLHTQQKHAYTRTRHLTSEPVCVVLTRCVVRVQAQFSRTSTAHLVYYSVVVSATRTPF
jgi:hypothetical protein